MAFAGIVPWWNRCRWAAASSADARAARTSGQASTRPRSTTGVVERRTASGSARGSTPASSRIGLSTIAGMRAVHPFDEDAEIRKRRSEEHTSELQSLMRISYAVFCLKKKQKEIQINTNH